MLKFSTPLVIALIALALGIVALVLVIRSGKDGYASYSDRIGASNVNCPTGALIIHYITVLDGDSPGRAYLSVTFNDVGGVIKGDMIGLSNITHLSEDPVAWSELSEILNNQTTFTVRKVYDNTIETEPFEYRAQPGGRSVRASGCAIVS